MISEIFTPNSVIKCNEVVYVGGTIISATDVMLNSGNYSVDMRCVTNEWEWWKQPELERK